MACLAQQFKIGRSMTFDPHVALAYARRFARPRLAGSAENQRVASEIASLLEARGCRVTRETFAFSTAYNVFITVEVLACLLLALASLAMQAISPWASALLGVGIVAVIGAAPWLNRAAQAGAIAPRDETGHIGRWQRLCLRLGRRFTATNLIATLPGASDEPALPHIMLVAHYDSKSQRLPIAVRVTCFALAIAGSLLYAAMTMAYALTAAPALGALAIGSAAIAVIAGIPLLFLDLGNTSPGAIDNASGLGTLLHLAEILAQQRNWQNRLRLTLLITGAEEIGVAGAAAHVRRHLNALRCDAQGAGLRILNFDGVGVDADLRLAGAPSSRRKRGRADGIHMAGWVEAAARDCGLRVKPFSMVGLSYDHVPFAEAGFDAVSLIAIGRATWAVHTPHDTAELLHPRGFAQAGAIALRVIAQMQQEMPGGTRPWDKPPGLSSR